MSRWHRPKKAPLESQNIDLVDARTVLAGGCVLAAHEHTRRERIESQIDENDTGELEWRGNEGAPR